LSTPKQRQAESGGNDVCFDVQAGIGFLLHGVCVDVFGINRKAAITRINSIDTF